MIRSPYAHACSASSRAVKFIEHSSFCNETTSGEGPNNVRNNMWIETMCGYNTVNPGSYIHDVTHVILDDSAQIGARFH